MILEMAVTASPFPSRNKRRKGCEGINESRREVRWKKMMTTVKQERRTDMSAGQESTKNFGPLCCGPWVHHRHPASKAKFGLLLVAIGLLWLGASLGLLDLSWLHAVPFWPAIFILFGAWLVYHGLRGEKPGTIDKERREV
jgi:hypothetical protein